VNQNISQQREEMAFFLDMIKLTCYNRAQHCYYNKDYAVLEQNKENPY